jgi:predicted nucleotidyltransferase component of viral defense system
MSKIPLLKKEIKARKVTYKLEKNRRLYTIKGKGESVKLELVFFPFSAIEKRKKMKEFSLYIDSLTDIIVNKTLSIYQRKESKDVYDLYYYLNNNPRYDLFKLIKLVEKKFGVAIEPSLLLARINVLADNLDELKPFLIKPQRNLGSKVKNFFQKEFNKIAKKQIK